MTTLDRIKRLFGQFLKEYYTEPGEKMGGFPVEPKSQEELAAAIKSYLSDHPYPEPDFYDVASSFYHLTEDAVATKEMLDRWRKAKGHPVEPIVRHALLYLDREITYEDVMADLKDGLEQEPGNPQLLAIGYESAAMEKDAARRLYYAAKLASVSAEARHHVVYGIECGKNLLLDRAKASFEKARQLDPKNHEAMLGLARYHLERLELGESEDLLEQSLQIEKTECAEQNLRAIKRLRNGKAWRDEEKGMKRFWDGWADKTLQQVTEEEQQRLMAECFASAGGAKGRSVPAKGDSKQTKSRR